jgi:hypothetical protein
VGQRLDGILLSVAQCAVASSHASEFALAKRLEVQFFSEAIMPLSQAKFQGERTFARQRLMIHRTMVSRMHRGSLNRLALVQIAPVATITGFFLAGRSSLAALKWALPECGQQLPTIASLHNSEIQQLTAHPLLASNLHYQPATEQQAWFLLNLERQQGMFSGPLKPRKLLLHFFLLQGGLSGRLPPFPFVVFPDELLPTSWHRPSFGTMNRYGISASSFAIQ